MAYTNRLKEARTQKKLTQAELAKRIGVAKSTYTGYEKGHSEPSILTLQKIMHVLEIDANYLFQDEINRSASDYAITIPEMQHIKKYRALDERGKDIVDTVLEKEYNYIQECDYIMESDVMSSPEMHDFINRRKQFLKQNTRPYAAADGDITNLEEARRRFEAVTPPQPPEEDNDDE